VLQQIVGHIKKSLLNPKELNWESCSTRRASYILGPGSLKKLNQAPYHMLAYPPILTHAVVVPSVITDSFAENF
jgi:hypothetical protein